MTLDDGEELIGRPDVFTDEITITSTGINKTYCSNCKKNQHCIHGTKKKKGSEDIPPVVMLKDKCSNDSCECRCRRFYSARNGKLKPLDTVDDTDPLEGFNMNNQREAIDDIIDKANAMMARKDNVSLL